MICPYPLACPWFAAFIINWRVVQHIKIALVVTPASWRPVLSFVVLLVNFLLLLPIVVVRFPGGPRPRRVLLKPELVQSSPETRPQQARSGSSTCPNLGATQFSAADKDTSLVANSFIISCFVRPFWRSNNHKLELGNPLSC